MAASRSRASRAKRPSASTGSSAAARRCRCGSSPGRAHRFTLTKPGYETATRELSVAADSGRRLQIDLTPQYGEIEVASTPANAEVWVDGERRGSTPADARAHGREPRDRDSTSRVSPRSAPSSRRGPGYPQKLERHAGRARRSPRAAASRPCCARAAGQELKLVPAGQFTMGSSRREIGRRSNEMLRPVRVTRAFYLGAREVTNAEFRAFKADHDSGDFERPLVERRRSARRERGAGMTPRST